MATTSGVTTIGNRTIFFGGASGIDTSSLITAAYNAKKLESDNLQTRISKNTAKIAGYSQLQSLSQAIQTSLTNIKKDYSILATNSSVFSARTGSLTSSSSTSPQSLVSVSIDPGTDLGIYEIEVVDKAQAHKVMGSSATTDPTAALGYTGAFDIGLTGSTASNINVTSGMSLNDLADAINAQKDTTGVGASVLKTSSSGYALILTGTQTNKDINVTNISGTDVLQSLGVLDNGGGFVNEIQQAQGAQIILDGTPITRDDNNFNDLIDGVSLTVKNSEPGTTLTLNVENDTAQIENSIKSFVDAYNVFRDFITANQKVTDGAVSDDAVLFGDFTMKNLSGDIQSLLAGNYNSSSSTIQTLRDIGITIDGNNHLVIDSTKLGDALADNFDEVKNLFQTSTTSNNDNFRMSANTSRVNSASFTLDITYSGGAITSVSVGGNSSLFDISGAQIKGKTGTAYEGMTFAYVGTTSASVNFSMTQGLGDLINNRLNLDSDVVTGGLQSLKVSLDSQNTQMESRSTRVLERAEDYRQKLIDKYAAFESRMAQAQTILAQIQAIVNSQNNKN